MRTITLAVAVGGLSCASCAAGLEAAVSHGPGMEGVTVDLAMERVAVTFDTDATSVHAIATSISAGLG